MWARPLCFRFLRKSEEKKGALEFPDGEIGVACRVVRAMETRERVMGGGGWTNEVSQGADEPAIHTIPSTGEYNSDQSPALYPDDLAKRGGRGLGIGLLYVGK